MTSWHVRPIAGPPQLRTCPNCGKSFKALGFAHHYAKCSDNAAARMAEEEAAQGDGDYRMGGQSTLRDAEQAQWLFVGDDDPRNKL